VINSFNVVLKYHAIKAKGRRISRARHISFAAILVTYALAFACCF